MLKVEEFDKEKRSGQGANSGQESPADLLAPTDSFPRRHIGPGDADVRRMLDCLGYASLDELIDTAVPSDIRLSGPMDLGDGIGEQEMLEEIKAIASRNEIHRSFIGMGYSDCVTPPVIQRNILENPGWYTQYTPYQPELAQGRLEALLNFQTLVIELTAMEIANASLLDEGSAAAEAMTMAWGIKGKPDRNVFFVSERCHPQTIGVVQTRARALGIEIREGDHDSFEPDESVFGVLLQYPTGDGAVLDYEDFIRRTHEAGGLAVVAADLLSLTLLRAPGEFGADIAVGNTQRFGVPLGYGGPHAAYFATLDKHKRRMPGRLIGVSHDSEGNRGLRLSLQTREQHIRRDKATSNICTAQVLLAVMASMYAVYHGPDGLRTIARRIRMFTLVLREALQQLGYDTGSDPVFDTLRVKLKESNSEDLLKSAQKRGMLLRSLDPETIGISLDETTREQDILNLIAVFADAKTSSSFNVAETAEKVSLGYPAPIARTSDFLRHPVFNSYHTETEMLRYMRRLEAKEHSLTESMTPLGSCTMKLNATAEMIPVTWPEFGKLHPFAPVSQAEGYQILFKQLQEWLAKITGFEAVSLQPNAGSQGEFAGLQAIRNYHEERGESHRNICLIPVSAHGTNPASAILSGMKVVAVQCDDRGNIDLDDLRSKAETHADHLAALMVTYPSTHGVFEKGIRQVCSIIHEHGGQVYLDGANLNAMVGLSTPAAIGADVCHLNLHKTFCIPHGGGGPGVGPIAAAEHLAPHLPGHPVVPIPGARSMGPVAAAPWGSAGILVISWAYIRMMGGPGLTRATRVAILNANYIAKRLEPYYPVLYRGNQGLVAHECIIDFREWKTRAGIEVEDGAKRLMDYGFHAPTMSWPVPGTMMIEPTESESRAELDRFCDAMIAIHDEMKAVEDGEMDRNDNVLKNAPHTASLLAKADWKHPYSREQAAYPAPWTREHKFWPPVGRVDNVYGDRNLVCTCPSVEESSG